MSMYGVVENPDDVNYAVKCCCKTTDDVYYEVPKEYFRLNQNLVRRKLILDEPFQIPLDSNTFMPLLKLLEKAALLSAASVEDEAKAKESDRPEWMRHLNKRQEKFVSGSLGIQSWDGNDVPFYEKALPDVNEVVWVKVIGVNDTSAVVNLMEYGKRKGIIPYTEVTRRRVRSMGKLIKVGRSEAAQVIRIDADKGYIDLSKKQVLRNEAKDCEAKYRKGSEVRSIICHVAGECDLPPIELMEKIAFPLYRREPGKHAWNWLNELNQTQNVDEILGPLNLPQNVVDTLMMCLKNAMRLKVLTLQAVVEITCYECDGVEAIRDVLMLAKKCSENSTSGIPLSLTIIGPPKYGLRARTDMKEDGFQLMKDTIEMMKIEIAKRGGNLKVTTAPQAIGDDDKPERTDDQEDEEDDFAL